MSSEKLAYRPDIDGLRALAVLAVVAFHIDESLVPGGFIGVDIFFVISGYLITAIIHRDMVAGTFSFADFYKRRILRIAPAYFLVTASTLAVGSMLLLPADLEALARSALWSTLSLPNVYFWQYLDTSYFAAASNQIPLLHLWSLGVEEQFYLAWPLTLLLLGRWLGWQRALVVAIGAMIVGSFVLAERTVMSAPSFAYYMLPTRAGELLLGAILAIAGATRSRQGKMRPLSAGYAEVAALLGFGLIAWGLFRLDGESLFPGINALYPCLGTVLLIHAGTSGSPRLMAPLRWRPVVWIGLISYSLYLWHWPVLAFTRYFTTTITPSTGLICLIVMLALAWISYRWVELPFRGGLAKTAGGRHAPAAYAISAGAIALVALSLYRGEGTQQELANSEPAYARQMRVMQERMQAALSYDYNCQRSRLDPELFADELCVIRPRGVEAASPVQALLIGDSNAAHYIGVIAAIGAAEGFSFRNVSVSSCPPLFGAKDSYGRPEDRKGCTNYRNAVREQARNYDYVLLGAQWSYHGRTKTFRRDLDRTLKELSDRGTTVVLLGNVPLFSSFDQNCELRRIRLPQIDCKSKGPGTLPAINKLLRSSAAKYPHVHYMDVTDVVCPNGNCSPYLKGLPIYYNPGHLSMTGSHEIGQAMVKTGIPLQAVFSSISPRHRLQPAAIR